MTTDELIPDLSPARATDPASVPGAAPAAAGGSAAAERLSYLFRHCPPGSASGVLLQRLARYRARGTA
jgi:hypothetical protein